MMEKTLKNAMPEMWPEELWRVLAHLYQRVSIERPTPFVQVTPLLCPEYLRPLGENHTWFNRGLAELGDLIDVRWNVNHSLARTIRLKPGCAEILGELIRTYYPNLLPTPQDNKQLEDKDLMRVMDLTTHFGPLGLRTAAHLAFGDSHALDSCTQDIPGVWRQADAGVKGGSIVRCGGLLHITTPSSEYHDNWERPGHYLWDWEITRSEQSSWEVGDVVWLIENPYLMWELMSAWRGRNVTLICLHGETTWADNQAIEAALPGFITRLFYRFPNKKAKIWCDPDPAGLLIASHAARLIEETGGRIEFYQMDEDTLDQVENVVTVVQKLKPINGHDKILLQSERIDRRLFPLYEEIVRRQSKGEQEGLVLLER